MHKIRVIESTLGYPQKNRMESESYEGVQTYMDMKDGSLIAVQPNKDDLMSQILSPDNLNRAYLQVVRNKGVGGVDRILSNCFPIFMNTNQNLSSRYALEGTNRIQCVG